MKLKSKYIEEIRSNQEIRVKLQVVCGFVSETAISYRLKKKQEALTEYGVLSFLSKEFGIPIEDLLEPDENAVVVSSFTS